MDEKSPPEQSSSDPSSPGFVPVCAIGASAGGVSALQTLFRLLPDNLGLAYVVVMHLAPDHPSAMDEILGAVTKMPVHQVQDGPTLLPNQVYVIAPDRELIIEGDDVKSRPFTDPRARRAPIDMFFRSIATGRGDGIAVVLTGAGSDGAVGVRAIKEAGGIVMVQEPAEAGFPSMPQNAIATGVADVVAPLARLAERIAEAARSKGAVRSLDEDGDANYIRRIITFLRTRTGHDFSGYKRSTVLRRIARRMQVCQIVNLSEYAQHLRETPEEAKALFSDLLISVTMFFRDPDSFVTLTQRVIRPLLERRNTEESDDGIRAWVVGCATGEEAYSLAILLLEEAERQNMHVQIQIFATDLDEGALATAREGRYPRSVEADVSAERLKRFFVDEGTHYRIASHVRDLVLFATHSVVREPPFIRLDLVTCRNVLIYLERILQQHVCGIFHYGLKPEGYLFLGTAETADASQNLFSVVDRDARIYRWLPSSPEFVPSLITAPVGPIGRQAFAENRQSGPKFEAGEILGASHAAALEAGAPPSALVDADSVVLHLSPTAGRFVLLSAGPLSGRLPSIVRPELRLDLKLTLDRVFDTGQPAITRLIDVQMDGEPRRVSMHVAPVERSDNVVARALVYFLDNGPGLPGGENEAAMPLDELQHLHSELKFAQELEQAGRIRHDSAVQELRANNEELQSLNEEYRSTAEELETSKEELQSINEELQTVNAELKSKLSIISAAHNDLQNLTASSEIGTLFLDRQLRIRMFTPRVADVINVAESDVGRPLTDFTHRLDYDGMERDVRRVLRDQTPTETEIRAREGGWFMVRIRPYRTTDGGVEGAVVTFDDISDRKTAEMSLAQSEAKYRALVSAGNNSFYRMNSDWGLMYRLDSDTLADTPEPIANWQDKYILTADRAHVEATISEAIRAKSVFELEHRVLLADGSIGWVLSRAVPLIGPDNQIAEWAGAASDITERKRAEAALRESEEKYRTLYTQMGQGLIEVELIRGPSGDATDYRYVVLNPAYERLTGIPIDKAIGRPSLEVIPDLSSFWAETFQRIVDTHTAEEFEYEEKALDRWFGIYAYPGDGDRLTVLALDITQRKKAEAALRDSEERFRTLFSASPVPFMVLSPNAPDFTITAANEAYFAAILTTPGTLIGRRLFDVFPDDPSRPGQLGSEALAISLDRVLKTKRKDAMERVRYDIVTPDGRLEPHWWLAINAPMLDAAGNITAIIHQIDQQTELHVAQEAERENESMLRLLLAELQHRVRNILATVRAVATRTGKTSRSLAEFQKHFDGRLSALGRTQNVLTRAPGTGVDLENLVREELLAQAAPESQISLKGPNVGLSAKAAEVISLAIHELATNSIKYGSLARKSARVKIEWNTSKRDGDQWLSLLWQESGMRLKNAAPQRRGFGTELITLRVPHELQGEGSISFEPGGIRALMSFPLREGKSTLETGFTSPKSSAPT